MDDLLQITDLCAGYGGRQVLHGVSFSVAQGEVCALLGANGSGKSTLMRALCGLTDASGGCMLKNENLWDMSQRCRAQRIGYLAQRSSGTLSLSALDVVLMGCNPMLGVLQRPSQAHRRRARELMEELGAGAWAQKDVLTLSEGQRQLVMFARTLMCRPSLLLLDEPDSALDYDNRHRMLQWLCGYAQREQAGILLCSHDANIALRYAQRLLLLKDGRLLHDLCLKDADETVLREALGKIYGPVEVLRHGKHYLMTRGDAE